MPEHDDTQTTAPQVFDRAPEAFGLVWEYARKVKGERELFIARGDTPEYTEAYRRCRQELRDIGFSNAEPYWGDTFTGTRPCFWMTAAGWSPAAVEAVEALVPVRRREVEEREAAWKAEREAREAAVARANESLIEDAKAAARRSLGTRRWSWVRPVDIEEAEGLITDPGLGIPGARRLLDLVKRASANVARTEQKITIAYEPELARAGDADVRAAAVEALAHVTAFDADRAAHRNDIGWSRATTLAGHVLTGKGDLDATAASHALRILRIHHGQVPAALRARLFGDLAVAA